VDVVASTLASSSEKSRIAERVRRVMFERMVQSPMSRWRRIAPPIDDEGRF
jgi:hypothetical protein